MNMKIIILLLVCLLLAFYAKLDWLVGVLAALTVLAALALPKPVITRAAASRAEEDTVLHPVIYEEAGGPSMYPAYQEITVKKGWPPTLKTSFEKMMTSAGTILKAGKKGVSKLLKEAEE